MKSAQKLNENTSWSSSSSISSFFLTIALVQSDDVDGDDLNAIEFTFTSCWRWPYWLTVTIEYRWCLWCWFFCIASAFLCSFFETLVEFILGGGCHKLVQQQCTVIITDYYLCSRRIRPHFDKKWNGNCARIRNERKGRLSLSLSHALASVALAVLVILALAAS